MSNKGFFSKLFDLSFQEFITTSVIKVIFVIGIIISVIYALILIGAGFSHGAGSGIVALILSPVVFFVVVLGVRIYMELILVMFRISDNVAEINSKLSGQAPAAPPTVTPAAAPTQPEPPSA